VRRITAPADPNRQEQAVFEEVSRIRLSDPEVVLSEIAGAGLAACQPVTSLPKIALAITSFWISLVPS
jgi:hypothetical protein